jgi:hypothetical protein
MLRAESPHTQPSTTIRSDLIEIGKALVKLMKLTIFYDTGSFG